MTKHPLRCTLLIVCCVFSARGVIASPYGLDAYRRLETLPLLTPRVFHCSFSSYERNGANYDRGYFLYRSGAEYVMADMRGAGTLYRLWTTGQDGAKYLRVYADGSPAAIVQTFNGFFDGAGSPFLWPLIGNDDRSSGGFISYLPVSFSNSCRITSTDGNLYYNISMLRYHDGTPVQRWSATEPSADVRTNFLNAGAPIGEYTNTIVLTNTFDLAPGATQVLAQLSGPRVLHGVRIRRPDLPQEPGRVATDDGRAHTGFSQFLMSIAPGNDGVTLVRRQAYHIGNQKANVRVDGALAATWFDAGAGGGWLDSALVLSSQFTAGKSVITVRVEFVSSDLDWNEFRYWAYCNDGTNTLLTDMLDVANTASENAHSYTIGSAVWSGWRTFEYSATAVPPALAWSTGVWIMARWDAQPAAAVAAPLGLFFGLPFGVQECRSVMIGYLTNASEYYCWFPMPFAQQAEVLLINTGTETYTDVWSEIRHSQWDADADTYGLFHATYRTAGFTNDGSDYLFLETSGCGALVGVTHWMRGPLFRGYLEGDERFYIDGKRTPDVYGTGTEDYYNGGWYFNRGPFALPLHGNPDHVAPEGEDWTACYRLHLADRVPFRSHLRAAIEHGWENNIEGTYASVAYWYGRPQPLMTKIDQLDIGAAADEAAHAYQCGTDAWVSVVSGAYEGEFDLEVIVDTGRVQRSFSQMTFSNDASAAALLVRRRSDYAHSNQMAHVLVNGRDAGVWYLAGSNNSTNHADPSVLIRWRDDEFVVPAELCGTGPEFTLTLLATNSSAWSEFCYEVYAIRDPAIPEPLLAAGMVMLGCISVRKGRFV